ncbi:MAG: cadmium-translocating P-type ATPase [Defluviitaleaceae bacterium]|nr:cadmium-translocating P-type ATPase [Defluviitaleaceae bacterium]
MENCCQSNSNNNHPTHHKVLWLATGMATFMAGMFFQYLPALNPQVALPLFVASYLLLGSKVLLKAARNILRGKIFDENFLMGIATIGAIGIGKLPEATAVMLFYQVGEFFQALAVAKSKRDIQNLMDICPDYANLLLPSGESLQVDPNTIKIGDLILIKPGEKIPVDAIITKGQSLINTSALTGEPTPTQAAPGCQILSGCINQTGLITARATKTFDKSTASKILDLVENAAENKAPTETFITKFAKYYTPAVVAGAVLLAAIPPLFFGGEWGDWIYRSLIFLIISCPCALVLSIPMGFFGGIGSASRRGILVKGGNFLEAIANLHTVAFDKTGTLTQGQFKVTGIHPTGGLTAAKLLEYAAHAEAFSSHPIAQSILREYGRDLNNAEISQYEETPGYGITAIYKGKKIQAGSEKFLAASLPPLPANPTQTTVHIAADGIYAGNITIADEIKPDSHGLIPALKNLGIRHTVMLSGDNPHTAQAVAHALSIDETHASLLPHQKIEKLRQLPRPLAYLGDGINDAPALATADIGIAMGGLGSDAAIEAADIVIMTDQPSKLIEAIKVARFTKRVVWQNIILALTVQILFLFLATLGISSLWEAVFADVGVSLITVLNSMRILKPPEALPPAPPPTF